ncbi:MAG: bifunctional precorrin-2 dehydrogenase/sirohydrochlorin ferrochelatase [Leptospiraceae bacterium]|nr:bifunctional precorrin-2 dehydrogenase/sirohydrochlorin ferrochelatase [Leptospiraceae bacterium]
MLSDTEKPSSELLPVFLKLHKRPVLVAGAGMVALEKIEGLLLAQADIQVISLQAIPEIRELAGQGKIKLKLRKIRKRDLLKKFMVYVAIGDKKINERLRAYATRKNILLNVVDDPVYCDFYSASVVRKGPWRIAVSTQGKFAGLSSILSRTLQTILPDEQLQDWNEMTVLRERLKRATDSQPERTQFLRKVLQDLKEKVLSIEDKKIGL